MWSVKVRDKITGCGGENKLERLLKVPKGQIGISTSVSSCMYDPNRDIFLRIRSNSLAKTGWWVETCRVSITFSLSPIKQCYTQVEEEALSLTWACEWFQYSLLGSHFGIRIQTSCPTIGRFTSQDSTLQNKVNEVVLFDSTCSWETFRDCRCTVTCAHESNTLQFRYRADGKHTYQCGSSHEHF